MTEKNDAVIFTFTARTAIWTGDANGESGSLKHTGLLGSIRWWFEVVVRGLGGYACDPSNTKCQDKNHCVVCELFGCTGWARKFRFDVLGENDEHIQEQILKDKTFKLKFTPLRPIKEEEWVLLSLTLKLISRYKAIGGKAIPKSYRKDFGLIELIPEEPHYFEKKAAEDLKKELRRHIVASQFKKNNNKMWDSLNNLKLEEHAWSKNNTTNVIDEILDNLRNSP